MGHPHGSWTTSGLLYGPTMNAFAAADAAGRAADLQKELVELFSSQNTSQRATTITATFLRVTVTR